MCKASLNSHSVYPPFLRLQRFSSKVRIGTYGLFCLALVTAKDPIAQETWLGKRTVIPGVVPKVETSVMAPEVAIQAVSLQPDSGDNGLNRALASAVGRSDLIFHGRIISVDYLSAQTQTDIPYPLTYLTFQIIEVLSGDYPEQRMVLMLPGVGRTSNNQFALSSDLPVLAKDDELVMFLAADSINGPRYVHHLFAIDGAIFSDDSRALVVDESGRILPGVFTPQERILERPLGESGIWLVHGPPVGGNGDAAAKKLDRTEGTLPSLSRLTVYRLRTLLPDTLTPVPSENRSPLSPTSMGRRGVTSADSQQPLFFDPRQGLSRRD